MNNIKQFQICVKHSAEYFDRELKIFLGKLKKFNPHFCGYWNSPSGGLSFIIECTPEDLTFVKLELNVININYIEEGNGYSN